MSRIEHVIGYNLMFSGTKHQSMSKTMFREQNLKFSLDLCFQFEYEDFLNYFPEFFLHWLAMKLQEIGKEKLTFERLSLQLF